MTVQPEAKSTRKGESWWLLYEIERTVTKSGHEPKSAEITPEVRQNYKKSTVVPKATKPESQAEHRKAPPRIPHYLGVGPE